jgi:hypothetical protein
MRARRFSRRLLIVVVAVGLAALLLHPQISAALVTRGDTLAYWGNTRAAMAEYERALLFDRGNVVAADRYAFDASLTRDPKVMARATSLTESLAETNGGIPELLFDRALCFQRLGNYSVASKEFARAGRALHDPRAMMFAALDQRQLRNMHQFRSLLREAVAFDRAFTPASRDLALTK